MDIFSVLLQPHNSLHTGKSWIPKNFPSAWQGLNLGACRLLIVLLWGTIQIPKKLLLISSACEGNANEYRTSVAPLQTLLYPSVISMGCPMCVENSKKNLACNSINWWRPGAVLVFLLLFIISRKCLFQRVKALIIWLVEGLVSLISYTLVLASFKKIIAALLSLVPVCSDQPFQRGMKAAFPHLKKEKRQKRLLQHQVFKVPSLACSPEMKRKLNIVFSKGLLYPCWI